MLNPSQHVKSAVIAHKEKTVQEILSVASQVPIDDALKLLSRGEQFVRAALPDASAKRKLSSLLLLRVKRMQPGERRAIVEELVPMLVEVADNSKLEELLDLDEQEVLWLLSQVNLDLMRSLRIPEPRKILVSKELARRIPSSTVADEQGDCLNYLWDFLREHEGESWAKATSLVLATFHSRLTAQLEVLDTKLLRQACDYLKSRDSATSFAVDFFSSDLGISTLEHWPPKSSSSIFAELASRLDEKHEEKVDFLAKAYELDDSDEDVRCALAKQLSQQISQQGLSDEGKHLEGLLLKVFLEKKEEIPAEVIRKLSLQGSDLKALSADELMLLTEMLKKADRRADGARAAVAAAELFTANGKEEQSQEALAYLWDLWDWLCQNLKEGEDSSWAKATSLVLATFHSRLTAQLEVLDAKLLRQACDYLKSRDSATSFAVDFFSSDLGISTLEHWPPKSSSSIFAELASRLDEKHEEKVDFLAKAYELDDSDEDVRRALVKQLNQHMLRQSIDDNKHLEGLLLKVYLGWKEDIPVDVTQRLSLRPESLKNVTADQLMLLAEMLKRAKRRADGARIAVSAAEAFSAEGKQEESYEAVAYAHYLDRANDRASFKLCELLGSIVSKCKDLGNKYNELDHKCHKIQELKAEEEPIKCISSFSWDLSGYDFSSFTEDQREFSEKFPLGVSGIEAWLGLRPKAAPDKASLSLWVNEPVWVKCRVQAGDWKHSLEYNFSTRDEGGLQGVGWGHQIPTSQLASGITFHLLSVRRGGSSLRWIPPGSTVSRPRLIGLTALRPQEAPPDREVWLTCGLPELAQSSGKFYYEVQLLSEFDSPQIGWLNATFQAGEYSGEGVGDDPHSWAFDGERCLWWNNGKKPLQLDSPWKAQDVLGFAIDLDEGKMQLCTKEGGKVTMPSQAHGALQLVGHMQVFSFSHTQKSHDRGYLRLDYPPRRRV